MDTFPASLKPDRVASEKLKFNTTVVEFENQYDQRFASDHVGLRKWKLYWSMLDQNSYDTLLSFFNSQLGRFAQWTIEDVRINGGAAINVFFANDEIEATRIKHGFYRCEVEIETR